MRPPRYRWITLFFLVFLAAPALGDRTWTVECDEEEPQCVDDDTALCTLSVSRNTDDPDFTAANIADGVNILGVTGTFTVAGDTTTGLTHNWKFDDTSGTNATETVGGKTGVLTGGPVWAPTEGINGGALYFDGTNDVVIVGTPAMPTGDFTVSAWVSTPLLTSNGGVMGIRNSTPTNEFSFLLGANPQISVDGFAMLNNFGPVPQANGWHLVAVTRVGELVSFWLDGIRQFSVQGPGTLNYSTCSLFIGAEPTGVCGAVTLTTPFMGLMDDVRVYSRGLAAADLRKLHSDFADSPTVQTTDLTTGLVLHLPFEENTGTAINDAGPNNHDGVLVGGPTWIAGKVGSYAVNLDNSNDYISIASPNTPTANFTFAGWFKFTTLSEADSLFSQQTSSAASTTSIDFNRSSALILRATLNAFAAISNVPGTYTQAWVHLAVTRRGSFLRLYINGTPRYATQYGTALNHDNACALLIGIDADGTACTGTLTDPLGGGVDDVWVFDRALTDAEVAALAAM